jgi:hypothetical protein
MLTTTNQSIYFSNKSHIPIEDVANSLLAFKSLLEATPDVFERLIPGLHIKSITVDLIEIKSANYIGDFAIRLVFSDGVMRLVDFKSFLENSLHPSIRKYLDETQFKFFEIVYNLLTLD